MYKELYEHYLSDSAFRHPVVIYTCELLKWQGIGDV
jgi:hypothetical protein